MPKKAAPAYPFLHLGHGLSAARKDWSIAVVLREPLDGASHASVTKLARPKPLDFLAAEVGSQTLCIGHCSDSLQWVVAASYPNPGARADKGEATDKQWKAFNEDLDAYLTRLHTKASIAAVIRTVDDEYSTVLSPWHEWTCRELSKSLGFVAQALKSKSLLPFWEHGCELWRRWLAKQPLTEQQQVIAALEAPARAALERSGGVPKPIAPPKPVDSPPTLDEQKRVWFDLATNTDPFVGFEAAFAHLSLNRGAKWTLAAFRYTLQGNDDALLVDLSRRALASPNCKYPNTDWRPALVEALLRLQRFDEARGDVARMVLAAQSYHPDTWSVLVKYLDATRSAEDGDVIFHLAKRYVTAFSEKPRAKRAQPDQKERATALLLELAAPFSERVEATDQQLLKDAALLFKDLVRETVATEALLSGLKKLRAQWNTRRKAG